MKLWRRRINNGYVNRSHTQTPRAPITTMLFYSFFRTLVGNEVVVELKNDLSFRGKLHSVDQFLNVKLENVSVVDTARYPQLQAVGKVFLRGSVVRYIQIPKDKVDTELLQDAARREAAKESSGK